MKLYIDTDEGGREKIVMVLNRSFLMFLEVPLIDYSPEIGAALPAIKNFRIQKNEYDS